MRYKEIIEAAGVGQIVPGVNTTVDVKPGTLNKMLKSYFGKAGVDPSGHIKRKKKKKSS